MKIKQFEMVPASTAVLAFRKKDFKERCYDRKTDGHNFAWALIDTEDAYDDRIALIAIDSNGKYSLCETCLLLEREKCPKCKSLMNPFYDNHHKPTQWQECPSCGYIFDMDNFGYEEGGESDVR